MLKIIECPRDAMQGLHDFIPTEVKANYINQLLTVGFDTIDFGSFVSPKAIPQLRDTAEVLNKLNLNTDTNLLSIVANSRGAEDACKFEEIDYLGFPFSISQTFQKRNTNSTIEESLARLENIQNLCVECKCAPISTFGRFEIICSISGVIFSAFDTPMVSERDKISTPNSLDNLFPHFTAISAS